MSQFHLFQNELSVCGEVHLVTPLHIGAGNNGLFGVGNEVVKRANGAPYIPGSSLKGTLRSVLERLSDVATLPKSASGKSACISTDDDHFCLKDSQKYEVRDIHFRNGKQAEEIAQIVSNESCILCHLFGNTMMAGKVQFFDSEVVLDSWGGRYDHRDGVGIDRDSGTTKHGVKYEFEAVPAGTAFHFSLRASNLTDEEKVWLFVGLELLRSGEVTLGGKAARGLGKVEGANWKVLERNPNNFFAALLKKEGAEVPFESYATPLFAPLQMEV
ncbi:CRISPR-associated RAMP protein [Tumebacillus algifaecis]|uniref:CRISPR-associated RAMP protein n=1 Tax=Tumebacillus algifaecis TaxID=1214604 RepID=A0A223CYK9_9BACL|nr:CRISPR-associated RAMP protein Csx7 [Tumebacillus algifaecis]ASS74489.1 CRISPR-associated RAMP protein [Tumebacillus algifaecis]